MLRPVYKIHLPAANAMSRQRFDKRCCRLVATVLAGLMLVSVNLQASVYSRDEIAFCPSGGPTGWMNYFDKRDREKRWKSYWRYRQYQQPAQPGYSRSTYHYQMFHQPRWPATAYYRPQTAGGQGFGYR